MITWPCARYAESIPFDIAVFRASTGHAPAPRGLKARACGRLLWINSPGIWIAIIMTCHPGLTKIPRMAKVWITIQRYVSTEPVRPRIECRKRHESWNISQSTSSLGAQFKNAAQKQTTQETINLEVHVIANPHAMFHAVGERVYVQGPVGW